GVPMRASDWPHSPQNFRPASFWAPQLEQNPPPSDDPSSGERLPAGSLFGYAESQRPHLSSGDEQEEAHRLLLSSSDDDSRRAAAQRPGICTTCAWNATPGALNPNSSAVE